MEMKTKIIKWEKDFFCTLQNSISS